jgi:hypothetical protein
VDLLGGGEPAAALLSANTVAVLVAVFDVGRTLARSAVVAIWWPISQTVRPLQT